MGIDIGEPNCRQNPITKRMDYYGQCVNRASRISDSAHGGQIVASNAIIDVLTTDQKATLSITYLGNKAYKGIALEVPVYQISSLELSSRVFPPLRQGKGSTTPKEQKPRSPSLSTASQASSSAPDDAHIRRLTLEEGVQEEDEEFEDE
jgi:hypothetical protein